MGKGDDRDLNSALDLFVGDTKKPQKDSRREQGSSGQKPKKDRARRQRMENSESKDAPKGGATESEPPPATTVGWVGRLPGQRKRNQRPKAKTTIRIDAELVNEYRERVFVERRPLGELIEQAMREHKERNW